MSLHLSPGDKSYASANHGSQQPPDWQYKNLNLNKLHGSHQGVHIQNNANDASFSKKSSESSSHETKKGEKSYRFTNEKSGKSSLDKKATKLSHFGEIVDQRKIQNNDGFRTNTRNSSTLSLHIAAYENSINDYSSSKESEFKEGKSKKNPVVKTWKTVKQLFDNKHAIGKNRSYYCSLFNNDMFEVPRQQNEEEVTEPEVMQFKASQQLLDPNQVNIQCFSPDCPWISQVLLTLAKIYQQRNIKLAIKFEFELLCQHLKIPLSAILPAYSYIPQENDAPYNPYDPHAYLPHFEYTDINIYIPIDAQLDVPLELPLFQMFPGLPNLVRNSMATAIAENTDALVKTAIAGSVALAGELVSKDFAQCPDALQMRRSYLYMVRSLTTAAVTFAVKEPLTTGIIGYLRLLIEHHLELVNDQGLIQLADDTMLSPTVASNAEILERGTEPDEETGLLSEKKLAEEVSFLCNNLSIANLSEKISELQKIVDQIDDNSRKWLAHYFVMKRITVEQNHHVLYNSFLHSVNDEKLNDYIKEETLKNINILLSGERNQDPSNWSFDERYRLKSLGRWLGLITIARSEPILYDELNLHGLLLDAVSKGEQELFYIVPFVVKILESSAFSGCFSPDCPWISQVLLTLAKIYQQRNIKLAIKFEFELLCQHLKIPLSAILPAYSYIPQENDAPYNPYDPHAYLPHFEYTDINIYIPIDAQLDVPLELPLFQMFPGLPNLVRNSMATAIAENTDALVKTAIAGSVALAGELVSKDFAQCPDALQMRRSYLYMVRSLTTAAVTFAVKEPLTTGIIGYLRLLIEHHLELVNDQGLIQLADDTMVHILEKNIEFACCYVAKAAAEKAMIELDKLMEETIYRRKTGTKLEIPTEIQGIIDKIPEKLRPISGRFDDNAISLYNAFGAHIVGFKPGASIPDPFLSLPHPRKEPPIKASVFRERSEAIFREWTYSCAENGIPTDAEVGPLLFSLMEKHIIPLNEGNILKILKIGLENCTAVAYELLSKSDDTFSVVSYNRNNSYYTVDSLTKLICFFVKSGDTPEKKLQLLGHSLEMLTNSLLADHDENNPKFSGVPMLRIFLTMVKVCCQPDFGLFQGPKTVHENLVESFGRALIAIQPRRAPAFAYHWFEIIGHRNFFTYFLAKPNATPITQNVYAHLLNAHLKFLAPYLRNTLLEPAMQTLYTATLRVMLVILHDFPELFCEWSYLISDAIPPNSVVLRNLVLSAYPSNMKLPDPYKLSFAAIGKSPLMNTLSPITSKMFSNIPDHMRSQLDGCLLNPTELSYVSQLVKSLRTDSPTPGNKYHISILNAVITYFGVRGITHIMENGKTVSKLTVAETFHMKIFQNLIFLFCNEGRYLLFNALANHLRYPTSQTHYFACTLLYLFKEAATDAIREQITRCILERLLTVRPHPWGLFFIFKELAGNAEYKFWSYDFAHFSQEIEQSFINLAKTCNVVLVPKLPGKPPAPATAPAPAAVPAPKPKKA